MQKRTVSITAPHQGILVSIAVKAGDVVQSGQHVAVMEAMKMEFMVESSSDGVVRKILVSEGETVSTGQPLLFIEPLAASSERVEQAKPVDLDAIRPDLQERRAAHRPRKCCGFVRCRKFHRVWRVDPRWPAPAAFLGGTDQAESGRWPGGGHRAYQRRDVS